MKKSIINSSIIFFALVSLASCTKTKMLDLKPLSEYSEVAIWNDPALIETFVNDMYREGLGYPFNYMRLSGFTDEALFALYGNAFNFNKSLMSPDGLMEWEAAWGTEHTRHLRWGPLYANVRRTNIFFSKINDVPATADTAWVRRLKGEAYFMRAYTYNLLVSLYGGVPLITHAYSLDDDFSVARNTYEECINFIVGQLDSAAMNLPVSYSAATQVGRATRGAALALKARVLLTAASDLHNPSKNSSITNGYSNPELLGYVGGDATERWKAAKDAARAVIDMGVYDLYKKNPAPTDSIAQNFVDYFISAQSTEEDILLQFFPTTGQDDYTPGLRVAPNGYNGHGANTPISELVDDYEMKDGTKFSWSNPVHKANPYANREPRFYATVLYEGASWRQRPLDVQTIDPFNMLQLGRVYDASGKMLIGGLDTRDGPVNVSNGGYTGYYLRKAVDPSVDPNYVIQNVPFRHIRYAEVLLNYAEACLELGQEPEARLYINMIRKRAGLPDLDGSLAGPALRDAYRHERRIELAFEEFRFWDIRRWMIGPQSTPAVTHAVDIRYTVSSPVSTYRRPDGTPWVAPVITNVEDAVDQRIWDDKDYFFPIMRDEINKNSKLIQNPRYN